MKKGFLVEVLGPEIVAEVEQELQGYFAGYNIGNADRTSILLFALRSLKTRNDELKVAVHSLERRIEALEQ